MSLLCLSFWYFCLIQGSCPDDYEILLLNQLLNCCYVHYTWYIIQHESDACVLSLDVQNEFPPECDQHISMCQYISMCSFLYSYSLMRVPSCLCARFQNILAFIPLAHWPICVSFASMLSILAEYWSIHQIVLIVIICLRIFWICIVDR